MLSPEINTLLTQTGPGTPAGNLLREYWHPVIPSESVSKPGDMQPVELLGEQLVVYRDNQGSVNIAPEKCPHRGASLAYGFVEDDGLRCSYHGWKFDASGQCIERPFETKAPTPACDLPPYRAREVAGLVFASLRQDGPPPFPMWDILAREDGGHRINLQEDLKCNWLQIAENSVDVTHTTHLHSGWFKKLGLADPSGFSQPLIEYGFQPFEHGIVKSWTYKGEEGERLEGWGNPFIFPSMLRIETEMHFRTPINDTQTRIIILGFDPDGEGVKVNQLPSRYDAEGRFTMRDFHSQDAMALETQGEIVDRSREVLGASDMGITMFRRMLGKAIESLQQGGEPPAQGSSEKVINLRQWMGGYLPMSAPADPTPTQRLDHEQIFDNRHRTFTVLASE